MKALRIFLLVLIIIGIGLLITQKIWVSKLVDYIISSENHQSVISPETQPDVSLTDGRQCYTYSHKGTESEPYTVSEFMDVTIAGSMVAGTKSGTQSGPDMTNGYTGTLVGTLDNNTMTLTYSYIVEGSQNKEEEIYRTSKTGIEKMRYPLMEKNGMLVPDTTKEFKTLLYARVGCTLSN